MSLAFRCRRRCSSIEPLYDSSPSRSTLTVVHLYGYGTLTMFATTLKNPVMTVPMDNRPSMPSAGATTIARGVKVEGDFASQGDVVIEGEVHGKITTAGVLTVGSEAVIKADVAAGEAVISGQVEGNLTVQKQVILHATARVKGDLTAERATVEAGATIDGKVQIGVSPKMEAKVAPKTITKAE